MTDIIYDPDSPSGLRWNTTSGGVRVGQKAGSKAVNGYWEIRIKRRRTHAHRIVWELHHGPIPDGMEVDHINGDPADNRIENLRLATRMENARNGRSRRGSSSRWCGVGFHKQSGRWEARIKVDGRHRSLKTHRCETAAALAYDRAAIHHFGEFARPNILTGV